MPVLSINGIDVDFPFTPYAPQIEYMSQVIEALRSGHNALLESPTGTGKTLCLLCATLAWRSTYVAALQARAHNALQRPLATAAGLSLPSRADAESGGVGAALAAFVNLAGSSSNDTGAPAGKKPALGAMLRAPRIVYASRTHSQLAQAVHELRRTTYRPSVVQLASRDQLCVNEIASKMKGTRLSAACRALTAPNKRGCTYHLPVASPRPSENRCEELVGEVADSLPMDIEEMRGFGMRKKACPWFLARAAAHSDSCEVLFIPYNYLLDRSARKSLDIDWSNDVVIVDEAHNLEDVCAAAISFDLTVATRMGCKNELNKCITRGLAPLGLSIPALESLAQTEEGVEAVLGTENRDMLEFRIMRSVLLSVDEFVETTVLPKEGGRYAVFPPDQLRKMLEAVNGPTAETYELFLELLDRAMGSGVKEEGKKLKNSEGAVNTVTPGNVSQAQGNNNPLQILQSAIRILFETEKEGHQDSFRVVVHEDNTKKKGRTLSYWCFDPQIAMKDLEKLGLRCMMLTSGTLSPLSTFAMELGISFPVRLENPHVITKDQVFAAVVKKSPSMGIIRGIHLSSAFRSRGEPMQLALGRTLLQVASSVPDGVLVFFPSYGVMNASIDTWKKFGPGAGGARPSTWEHLLRIKHVVVEERDAGELVAAMDRHRANVDSGHGSMLFAVCRGKVSEGIDFSDEYGRAVVITGLPYPSAFDPRVKLKRELADARFQRSRARQEFGVVLSGGEWYAVQAIRAVNQALGRAIRHRNDYGAVLLCDERFSGADIHQRVSKWLRPYMNIFAHFDPVPDALTRFFRHASTAPFADPANSKRALVARASAANSTRALKVSSARNRSTPSASASTSKMNGIVYTDLLAKYADLSDIPSMKREKQLTDTPSSSMSWDAGRAEGGSQTQRIRKPNSGKTTRANETSHSTISQRFLANRARKSAPPETARRNDGRVDGGVGKSAPRQNGAGRRPTMKERASAVFKKAEDQRQFVSIFRRIQTADKQCNERDGPLQSVLLRRAAEADGIVAAGEVVRFSRAHSSTHDQPAVETFLQELRGKVPVRFQAAYDTALVRLGRGTTDGRR